MNDLKQRSADTKHLLEICPSLENRLAEKFDDMLWQLMQNAAEKTHLSLEVSFWHPDDLAICSEADLRLSFLALVYYPRSRVA